MVERKKAKPNVFFVPNLNRANMEHPKSETWGAYFAKSPKMLKLLINGWDKVDDLLTYSMNKLI